MRERGETNGTVESWIALRRILEMAREGGPIITDENIHELVGYLVSLSCLVFRIVLTGYDSARISRSVTAGGQSADGSHSNISGRYLASDRRGFFSGLRGFRGLSLGVDGDGRLQRDGSRWRSCVGRPSVPGVSILSVGSRVGHRSGAVRPLLEPARSAMDLEPMALHVLRTFGREEVAMLDLPRIGRLLRGFSASVLDRERDGPRWGEGQVMVGDLLVQSGVVRDTQARAEEGGVRA